MPNTPNFRHLDLLLTLTWTRICISWINSEETFSRGKSITIFWYSLKLAGRRRVISSGLRVFGKACHEKQSYSPILNPSSPSRHTATSQNSASSLSAHFWNFEFSSNPPSCIFWRGTPCVNDVLIEFLILIVDPDAERTGQIFIHCRTSKFQFGLRNSDDDGLIWQRWRLVIQAWLLTVCGILWNYGITIRGDWYLAPARISWSNSMINLISITAV